MVHVDHALPLAALQRTAVSGVSDQVSDGLAALLYLGFVDGAVNLPANAAGLYQSGLSQRAKVPRRQGLADVDCSRQVRHSHLLVSSQILKKTKPGKV
jgi:hypothetical protein